MKYKLSDICKKVNGKLVGEDCFITGVAKIDEARDGEISFITNPKYQKFIEDTHASALIVPADYKIAKKIPLVQSENPYFTFLKTILLFHPRLPLQDKGIHSTAIIEENSGLGKDISLGPYVVVGKRCRIGNGTTILPGVVIGNDVVIGEECLIYAQACLRENVTIGNRVVIHSGAVIGGDGFGFAPQDGVYHKIPQVGTVVIEDDVEIGANVTVDRATLGKTLIKKGAKLDNLIQVAHNCTIGENTVLAAQVGLSGSTHIGNGVRVGGQAGFAGHITINDGAAIGAQAGVSKSVPPGVMVSGYPARPHREELRLEAAIHRLPGLILEIKNLKKKIYELEKKLRNGC